MWLRADLLVHASVARLGDAWVSRGCAACPVADRLMSVTFLLVIGASGTGASDARGLRVVAVLWLRAGIHDR
jgi:hypothetical protein